MDSKQFPALGLGSNSVILKTVFSCNGVNNKRMTGLTEEELNDSIQSILAMNPDSKDPFYVLDLGFVKSIMDQWNSKLPKIRPFYAVTCIPEPTFLASLAMLGTGFACASRAEIEAVLAVGVSADRIIYANICKSQAQLKYAANVGVNLATYDSPYEIDKIKRWHPKCALLLEINVRDDRPAGANNFGAFPEEVIPLLQAAQASQLSVVGVAFHLGGNGVRHAEAYRVAVASAKMVFDTAAQLGMPRLHMLDIGGGFTAATELDEAAVTIKAAIESYFGNEPALEMISEPGRLFAETSLTLVTIITGKRMRGSIREYWLDDEVYSPDCATGKKVKALAYESNPDNPTCQGVKTYESTVYGRICHCYNIVLSNYQLPELSVNDWLVLPVTGTYSGSTGFKFNDFGHSVYPTYLVYSNRSEPNKNE